MAETGTPRLNLIKPTVGTNELVDVADHLNGNWDKIDAAVAALPRGRMAARVTPTGTIGGGGAYNTNGETSAINFLVGRKYRIFTQFGVYAPSMSGDLNVRFWINGVALGAFIDRITTAKDFYNAILEEEYVPNANVTSTVKVETSQGAGVVVFSIDNGKTRLLIVEDVGPV